MINIVKTLIPTHITYKLSLFVSLVVILAFSALEVYNFINLKSELTIKIHKEQYTQAKFIAEDIREKMNKRVQFIGGLADNIPPATLQSETQLINTLKNNLKLTNIFPQGFAVIAPDGAGLIAEFPIIPGRSKLTFAQAEWFKRAQKSQETVISIPFISRAIGEPLVVIAKAIRDKQGKLIAILEAPIFLNQPGVMGYVFDKGHRAQGDILVLSRANEIFVASSNPQLVLKPTPSRGRNKLHDNVMDGFNGFDQTVNAFNKTMLTAAADITTPDWFVIVRTPIEEAYKSLNERLQTAIINGVLVSIFAVFTITFALFLFFTPLRKAAKSVNSMVQNDQPLTHIKSYKNDDIGDLITGFNSLIDMVNERNKNLEKVNAALEDLSQTDALTGASNRRYFDHTIRHSWRVHIRSQLPLTLIIIDIDYFKKYNDTYGHIAGDECLIEVSNTLQSTINRPTDFFARYGGEEFVILISGDIQQGIAVAEKARKAVSERQIMHSGSFYKHVTISLGIASIVPLLGSKPVTLVKKADVALYQSKANGRNRFEVNEPASK